MDFYFGVDLLHITFKSTMSSDYLLLFPSLSTRWIPATIGSSKSSSVV